MGYSATSKALDSLRTIQGVMETRFRKSFSNSTLNGFFEIGRENADGSVTGTVFRFTSPAQTHVTRAGGFRIEPDGFVTRFPDLPRDLRTEVNRGVVR